MIFPRSGANSKTGVATAGPGGFRVRRMSKQSRPPRPPRSLEAPLSEEEIGETIERAVDSARDFLRLLVRLAGTADRPGEPKP